MLPLVSRTAYAGWLLLAVLGVAGCDRPGSALHSADRSQRCEDIAARFGQTLVEGNYHAAYGLTSSRLQKRISLAEFEAAAEKARSEHGKPLKCTKVGLGTFDRLAGTSAARTYGFPEEIPDEDRLAWLHATLAVEMDGDEVLECYNCWLLVENEHGREKVGHFVFISCD